MKIVIDIPNEKYQTIINHTEEILDESSFIEPKYLYIAVLKSTPLPEGAKILTKEAYSDLCLRASKAVTNAVDQVTIKEYLDSFGKNTNVTSTDAVDRQEAINAAIEGADKWDGGYNNEREKCIREEIAKLSSVTPQPKMGRWKKINKEKYVQHAMSYYRCSECGKDIIGTHNYCPNCGCKMQEV